MLITGHRGQVLADSPVENTVEAVDARLLEIAGVAGVITDNPAALRAEISATVAAPTTEGIA